METPLIRRGTTPTIMVTVRGVDLASWPAVVLSLRTFSGVGVDIDKSELEVTSSRVDDAPCSIISAHLTQAQTLSWDSGAKVFVQVRARSVNDDAIASEIGTLRVGGLLKDGEV